jgi:hypothetical protein
MKALSITGISSLVMMTSLTVSSCQPIERPQKVEDNIKDESNKSLEAPSNVVKVLNNVTCSGCNQYQVNTIWQECLNQGYVQKSPNQRVIASRDISELVSADYTFYTTQYYTLTSTDANGIVTESKQSRQVPQYNTIDGECRGSEYILD